MNETILQYRDKLTQYWKKTSKAQKYMILGTIVILIAVLILTAMNLSKTEYVPAFTELQPGDAAGIKTYLDDAKISYELSPDGKTILVPAAQAPSIKLDVESQGLNTGGSLGYAAFENSGTFGMSDNEFNVKLINAIQGEIQQMFNQINGVASSNVLITVPKETAFLVTEKQDSTASVVLNIKSGYRFDQAQIDTMYNLVAKTVPNLKYENITISNQNSELLPYSKTNAGLNQSASTLIQQQFQIKNQFQTELQKNIMEMLSKIMGPNKVVVGVVSTLNFDQKTSTQNLVTPVNTETGSGIPISSQINSITSSSEGGANTGIPGTGVTDVPTYPATGATGGNSEYEETNEILNFEVNRIRNDIVSSPFIVKDLSINVGIEPPDPNNTDSLTQEMRDAVQRSLVSIVTTSLADSGVPYSEEELARRVTLFVSPFALNNVTAAPTSNNYVYYVGFGLLALLVAGLIGFLLRRNKAKQKNNTLLEEDILDSTPVELPTIEMENTTPENQIRKQLESLAKKKPEDFVNLLRTWLVDE